MAHTSERRASPRCAAVHNVSRLEFAATQGRQKTAARLVNLSRDGALIVSDAPPQDEPLVWVRIESPVKTDWVEAMIVRLSKDREIGVKFPGRCPDDVLLAGTIGIDVRSMISDGATITSTFD